MPTAPPTHRPQRIEAKTFGYDQTTRQSDAALARAKQIRSSKRWQRLRLVILRKQPLCADIYGEHVRTGQAILAEQVDHILGILGHPELAFTESNLQGLCTTCHARKSQEERAGGNI